jgi:peptidyl-tRNA hydrolase
MDMSDGYQVVQSAHSLAEFAAEHPQTFLKWKKDTNSIICLSVKDEETLLKLYEKLSKKTQSSSFYEPDVDAFTAICVYGTPEIRKSLSHLPLVLNKKIKAN